MATYLYKPGHPWANERGFVEKEYFYAHKYFNEPDMRMFNGNKPVSFNYISDEMPPTRHMACPIGHSLYTSKRKFRDETRARGCIEYGNENLTRPRKPIELDKRARREDIRAAIKSYKDGTISESEKAIARKTVEIAQYQSRNGVRKAYS